MNKTLSILVITVSLLLTGCQTIIQPSIAFNKQQFSNIENKVGIYLETEDATTHIYGASCLLCYGIASAANSSLSSHLESISLDDINSLEGMLVAHLDNQGKKVQIIELPKKIKNLPRFKNQPDFPNKDYRELKQQLNIDTLIVINLPEHGAYRSYSSYIPTSSPMGSVTGEIFTVDLNTNQYIQYQTIDIKVNVSGDWDEPSDFPGVTSAYYEAIEKTKEQILSIF